MKDRNGIYQIIIFRLRICKNNSYWLTIKYSLRYNEPITGFNVIGCEYESPEYLVYINNNKSIIYLFILACP